MAFRWDLRALSCAAGVGSASLFARLVDDGAAAAGEGSLSSSASDFARFLGVALGLRGFLLLKSEPSESEVYLTGAFARPERRADMVGWFEYYFLGLGKQRSKVGDRISVIKKKYAVS